MRRLLRYNFYLFLTKAIKKKNIFSKNVMNQISEGVSRSERVRVHPEAAQETGDHGGGQGGPAIRGTETEDCHSQGSSPQPQV